MREIKFRQDQLPNFWDKNKFYLVRCFACDENNGTENWTPMVSIGECAWCGWTEKKAKANPEKVWVYGVNEKGQPTRG